MIQVQRVNVIFQHGASISTFQFFLVSSADSIIAFTYCWAAQTLLEKVVLITLQYLMKIQTLYLPTTNSFSERGTGMGHLRISLDSSVASYENKYLYCTAEMF